MARRRSVIIYFSEFGEAEFLKVVHLIVKMLTANGATFPALPVAAATIDTALDAYDSVLSAPIFPGKTSGIASARKVVEVYLRDNGIYINTVGNGNLSILGKSGYPLSKEHGPHGPLPRTKMAVKSEEGAFRIRITPAEQIEGRKTVPFTRGYLVLYVERKAGVEPPEDYQEWKWTFFHKASGRLDKLKHSTSYWLVCVALGTHPSLEFSFPIDRTTQ